MNHPLISVIIPVYNVANYLPRCLDSICKQTYQNLEIILVDDGSTDNSLEICKAYAAKDKRMVVIHQQNGGLSAARNTGMDRMHGEFFTFVDSDDWISPDYCQELFDLLQKTGADVSCANYAYVFENGKQIPSPLPKHDEKIVTKEDCLLFGFDYIHTAWLKLYRTPICGSLRFDPYYLIHEDLDFFFRLCQHIESLAYTGKVVEYYFQRSDSLMHSFRIEDRKKILALFGNIENYCLQQNFKRAKQRVHEEHLRYGCFFTILSLLEKPFISPEEIHEVYAWVAKHHQDIFNFPKIGIAGHSFMRAFYYLPRITTWGCRLPVLSPLFTKIVLKKLTIRL